MDDSAESVTLLVCSRCHVAKPATDFAWRRKHIGQRDSYCRPCRAGYKQEHYAANRAKYIANAQKRKHELGLSRTAYLLEYFARHPCADCGESDPLVLEFDHLTDKSFNIGAGLRYRNWQSILNEIAKCDVVCANCHRRRTAIRAGTARAILCMNHHQPGIDGKAPDSRAGDGN